MAIEDSSTFATIALPLALIFIMVSLGLSLTPADFRRVMTQPRGVLIGLGNLIVMSPLLAFAVSELFALASVLAVGLVLLGSTPGGTSANLFTHLAKGETALSVSMTAISSLLATITVPLYLGLAIEHFDAAGLSDDVDVLGISIRVFSITVVPLAIGMFIRARREEWSRRNEERMKRTALGALFVVIVVAVADEFDLIRDNFTDLLFAALFFNVAAMALSYTISRGARLNQRQATAVALELGIHNGTVAIAVAALIDVQLAAPAAVYTLPMFVNGALFARFMSRRNAAETTPADDGRIRADPAGGKMSNRLPPLLEERSARQELLLVVIVPSLFGAITGVMLGVSEIAYLVLALLGIAGGYAAGLEHEGGRYGAYRGLMGGLLFGVWILLTHDVLFDSEPKAELPHPEILLVAITALFGVALGALGGRRRAKVRRTA